MTSLLVGLPYQVRYHFLGCASFLFHPGFEAINVWINIRYARMERPLKLKQPMAQLLAIIVFIRKEVKLALTA